MSLLSPGYPKYPLSTFTLLSKVLEHLPSSWKVGYLYDIHHAVHKHDFPLEWKECLVWGVSIFHAYGHEWACQLWYHPWKDDLWGLSDSEGCEKLWSELRHLIPGLHVTGYHHHLFILDMQLEHITAKKHVQLSKWLRDHLICVDEGLIDATKKLGLQSIGKLLTHFQFKCKHHSNPLLCQSKGAV